MRAVLHVEGLAQVQRSLRQIGPAAAKGLRLALNEAAELLIDRVRPKIPSRTGAARRSLKARSSQKAVRIAVGGRRAPWYPWLDFGGRTGPGRSVVRPYIADGRYLYPGLRANRAEIQQLIVQRLREVAEDAGLEVD
jgi:hypothetical protein